MWHLAFIAIEGRKLILSLSFTNTSEIYYCRKGKMYEVVFIVQHYAQPIKYHNHKSNNKSEKETCELAKHF